MERLNEKLNASKILAIVGFAIDILNTRKTLRQIELRETVTSFSTQLSIVFFCKSFNFDVVDPPRLFANMHPFFMYRFSRYQLITNYYIYIFLLISPVQACQILSKTTRITHRQTLRKREPTALLLRERSFS